MLSGAHLALLGVLAHRSGVLPPVVGVLLVVAGAGYALDTITAALLGDSAPVVSSITFVGDFALAVLLVLRGG